MEPGTENDPKYAKCDTDKAKVFLDYFSSVFTTESDQNNLPFFEKRNYETVINDINITEEQIVKKLKKLKVNKSPGPDSVHPRIINELAETLSVPLVIIYNTSIRTKTLPMDWKHANVSVIFKKGSKTTPKNYRPVSLTSILCKTLESIVRDSIIEHMEMNNLFSKKQFGFITGRSTVLQLLHVLNIWIEILDQGGDLEVVYCDFMKAFDKVPHRRLIHKIEKYGITGNVLGWIESFLSDRTHCVVINNTKSHCAAVTSGIPQGSVLGPILFVIYINDLPEVVNKNSYVYLFADDTKVFRKINSEDDRRILQNDIDRMVEWSDTWLLTFHPDKCKVMRLGKKANKEQVEQYKMGTQELNFSDMEKDLGVHIDSNLSFESHINTAVNKANRTIAIVRKTFDYMDDTTFNLIFKGLVRPILEYAAPVWSPNTIKCKELLENVQRRATKMIPGFSDLSYPDRLRKLKLPTLAYRRIRGDMIQAYKVMNGFYDPNLPTLVLSKNDQLRGHEQKLYIKNSKKELMRFSFNNRTVRIWNYLPDDIVKSKDIISFEKALDHYWQDQDVLYNDFKAKIKIRCKTCKTKINDYCIACEHLENR